MAIHYIYEKADWTNFSWNLDLVMQKTELVSRSIGKLNARLTAIGFEGIMRTTMETVTRDIVSSSEIEGVSLNTQEVRSSVARKLGLQIKDEKEPTHYIEGVVEMMLDALMNFDTPLSESRLFGWHAALFPLGYSGVLPIHVAQYRKDTMKVVSGAMGRERVHYLAPAPECVPTEMSKFLNWLNNPAQPPTLIKSAISHLWFVSIHPFDDGNGRISRAISDMVLSQIDGQRYRFYSVSQQICKDKKHYYEVLEKTTSKNDGDITEWLLWYLDSIAVAVEESSASLSRVLSKSVFWKNHCGLNLSDRQQKGLNLFLDGYEAKLTIKNWANLLKVSKDSANRDIKELVERKIIKPISGAIRNVAYSIVVTNTEELMLSLSEISVEQKDPYYYIKAIYHDTQLVLERITTLDYQRYKSGELMMEDLVNKYLSYLSA